MKFTPFNSCRNCEYLASDEEDGYHYTYCEATSYGNLRSFPFRKAMPCFRSHRYTGALTREMRETIPPFIKFIFFEKKWGWTWVDHWVSNCSRCIFDMHAKVAQCGACGKLAKVQYVFETCYECHREDLLRVEEELA